ncbi:MAG TPA: hypothetical protein VG709_08475 [Actinomycetota bacterium]|nr:hypothetical protein [Actinomycetota bacterium]
MPKKLSVIVLLSATALAASACAHPEEEATIGERHEYRLLVHCGLSVPTRFDGRWWWPVDPDLRETIRPPNGFEPSALHDEGHITLVSEDRALYESSQGRRIPFEPTDVSGAAVGCE